MINYPVILLKACVIVMILAPIFFAVIVALAIAELVRSWRDARAMTGARIAAANAWAEAAIKRDQEDAAQESVPATRPWFSAEEIAWMGKHGISEGGHQ